MPLNSSATLGPVDKSIFQGYIADFKTEKARNTIIFFQAKGKVAVLLKKTIQSKG